MLPDNEFRAQRTNVLLTKPQGAAQMKSGTEVESGRGLSEEVETEFSTILALYNLIFLKTIF